MSLTKCIKNCTLKNLQTHQKESFEIIENNVNNSLCILCVEQQKSVIFCLEHSLSALIAGNFMDFLSFLGPPKKGR